MSGGISLFCTSVDAATAGPARAQRDRSARRRGRSWTRRLAAVTVAAALALTGHGVFVATDPAWAEPTPDEEAPDDEGTPDEDPPTDDEDPPADEAPEEEPDALDEDMALPEHCTRDHGNTQLVGEHLPRTPWAQLQLRYDQVHEITGGAGTTVAVVDTGVQFNAHQLAPDGGAPDGGAPDAGGDDADGDDADGDDRAPGDESLAQTNDGGGNSIVDDIGDARTDCDGHGTFIAGLIAGQERPADNDFVGLAPDAAIYAGRYAQGQPETPLDSDEDEDEDPDEEEEPDGSIEELAAAIYTAVDEGVDVINISSVATQDHSALLSAIQFAESRNVVVVAAAGNTAAEGNPPTYPASYDSVLAVGAVDEDGQLADFSQTSVPISVVAPGVDVDGPATSEGLYAQGGTSFAAGFVSATAALLRSHDPDMTAADIRHRIEHTADHPGRTVPDPGYGWGYLNPHEALTTVIDDERDAAPPAPVEQAGASYQPPPPPDTRPRDIALSVAAGAAGVVLLMSLLVATYRRGRKRGWRASQNTVSAADAEPI